jgi:hypothetical protein
MVVFNKDCMHCLRESNFLTYQKWHLGYKFCRVNVSCYYLSDWGNGIAVALEYHIVSKETAV